jgi:hypothetical protein
MAGMIVANPYKWVTDKAWIYIGNPPITKTGNPRISFLYRSTSP